MDNGYMLFNHHHVPHSALLARYASVDPKTGAYRKPDNPSSVYGSLTRGRSFIVLNARLVLARAVTVAVRYLSIRRQFRDRDAPNTQAGPEECVLSYPTVQIRILPLLATAFALHYSGTAMWQLYNRTRTAHTLDGDRAQLAELHITSAGLKSLATELAADGIETCRRAMGGHGYGGGTGLVQINADYLSKPTVEGDNWMITQQVARFLLAKAGQILSTQQTTSDGPFEANLCAYSSGKQPTANAQTLQNDTAILQAFDRRVAWLSLRAYRQRELEKRSWNSMLIDFHKLSRAYSQAMLVKNFHEALSTTSVLGSPTQDVLHDLFRLFTSYTIDAESREFQQSGAISPSELDGLSDRILELMQRIRPHAVKLVDSFALPDYLLDSALGRYDGKVYEALFKQAHVLNPLNRVTFNPDYRNDEIVMGSNDGGAILAKL